MHHIEPEGWILAGNSDIADPNNAPAIGLCEDHHDSKHPDRIEAKKKYREGNKKAFAEMGKQHHEMAQQGIIYWNNDTDESMLERSQEEQMNYVMNGGDKRPTIKRRTPIKKKRWYDNLFD